MKRQRHENLSHYQLGLGQRPALTVCTPPHLFVQRGKSLCIIIMSEETTERVRMT